MLEFQKSDRYRYLSNKIDHEDIRSSHGALGRRLRPVVWCLVDQAGLKQVSNKRTQMSHAKPCTKSRHLIMTLRDSIGLDAAWKRAKRRGNPVLKTAVYQADKSKK